MIWWILLLIPSCVGIAIIDHLLFKKWLKCELCGRPKKDDFVIWLLPTVLEMFCFITGVLVGLKGL